MKPSQRLALAAFLVVLAALFLAACGGGGDSDEDKITDVITEAVDETPEHCTELMTLNFNEQTQKASGDEAVEKCEEEAEEEDGPDSVEVTNVQVDGTSAEADTAFTGGDFDGQTLTLALVEEDDQWKLDEVAGFAEFDREKLLAAFDVEAEEEAKNSEEAELYECVAEGLAELEDEELEEFILSPSPEGSIELVEACQ